LQATSSQIDEYTNKGKKKSISIWELIIPNIYLVKKSIVGNMDSCFFHHSKRHLMFFTSTWYLQNISNSQITSSFISLLVLTTISKISKLLSSLMLSIKKSFNLK
jgi:hypothetical protein